MPRGNLEGVYPRAVTLARVAEALTRGDYGGAYRAAAAHRVDLNVLVDFAWPRAVGEAAAIVEGLGSAAALGELLGALVPGSVCGPGGAYADMWAVGGGGAREGPLPGAGGERGPEGKVARVCLALRDAMAASDAGGFLPAILASHLRADPADPAGALRWVRRLRAAELGQGPPVAATGQAVAARVMTSEGAMRHLLVLAGSRDLYRAALGDYDTQMAYLGEQRTGAALPR